MGGIISIHRRLRSRAEFLLSAGMSSVLRMAARSCCRTCMTTETARSCKSSFIIKRVVIAALLSVGLNLLADRCPTVRHCPAPLLRDKLGYVQNIRSLEYCACTLGKV